jgi:hypothetical protein
MKIMNIMVSIALCVSATGCASMKTTFFTRHEDETLCKDNEHPINGVPVMVNVPTHLEVKIQETIHLVKNPDTTEVMLLNDMAPSEHRILAVEPQLHYTEKMFVLDPKRPFSGSASYGMQFASSIKTPTKESKTGQPSGANASAMDANGHGYLRSLNYSVDDKTITNAIDLIASLGPMLASPVAKSKSQDEAKIPVGLHTTTRTVAYGLFDLASPSFEDELNAFLQLNLNNCSSCNGMTGTIPSKAVPYRASAPRRTSQANAASIAQSGDSHE